MTSPARLPAVDRTPADEYTALLEMLNYYRAVLDRKVGGLADDQLRIRLPMSKLTLGGLMLHMALVEDWWFHHRFAGHSEAEPWASAPWDDDPDWEFAQVDVLTGSKIRAQYTQSLVRSRATLRDDPPLDQLGAVTRDDGLQWNLRWILVHMVEEYARHCGHADLLRESIDGSQGDGDC